MRYHKLMPIQLTPAQHADLEQHGDSPMPVVDPISQKAYVLVAGDLYERVRALLDDGPFDVRDTYAAQEAALAKVWDDPALDVYNDDTGRPTP